VLTGGATEAINILAMSWGSSFLQAGDEIIVSTMEHHSNIIPWQMIAARTGAKLRFLNISPKGDIQVKNLAKAINFRTKLLAVTHVSHVLGSVNDIKSLVDYAKCVNVKVLVDACQSLPYMKVDVKQLGCDFLVGSGNKLFAAGGVGFLYVKQSVLKSIPAFLTGKQVPPVFRWLRRNSWVLPAVIEVCGTDRSSSCVETARKPADISTFALCFGLERCSPAKQRFCVRFD